MLDDESLFEEAPAVRRFGDEASAGKEGLSGLRANKLGVGAIVFLVVSAVAPMGAMVGGSPLVFVSSGAATPAIYLIVGALFAVFCVGYVNMSRHISNAGGFVAYVAHGFGPRAATATAGVTLVGYFALVAGLWASSE